MWIEVPHNSVIEFSNSDFETYSMESIDIGRDIAGKSVNDVMAWYDGIR
jgi:hypothetical protein